MRQHQGNLNFLGQLLEYLFKSKYLLVRIITDRSGPGQLVEDCFSVQCTNHSDNVAHKSCLQ